MNTESQLASAGFAFIALSATPRCVNRGRYASGCFTGASRRESRAPQPRVLPEVAKQVQPGLQDDEQREGDER